MSNFTGLGAGTLEDPYQITTVDQFKEMNYWGVRTPIFTGSGVNDLTAVGTMNAVVNSTYTITVIANKGITTLQNYNNTGVGYSVGDVITILGGLVGNLATAEITSVTSGVPTSINLLTRGSGYTSGSTFNVSGGTGSGLIIRVNSSSDYFSWNKDFGAETIVPANTAIVVDRITFSVASYTTHTIGDYWTIVVNTTGFFKLMNDLEFGGTDTSSSSFQIYNFRSHFDGNAKTLTGITTGVNFYRGIYLQNNCTFKNIKLVITNSVNNYETNKDRILFGEDTITLSGVTFTDIHIVTNGSGTLQYLSKHSWSSTCTVNNIVLEGAIYGCFMNGVSCSMSHVNVLRTQSTHWNLYPTVDYCIAATINGTMEYCQQVFLNLTLNIPPVNMSFLVRDMGSSGKIHQCFIAGDITVNYTSLNTSVCHLFTLDQAISTTHEITDCYYKGNFSVNGGEQTNSSMKLFGKSGFVVGPNVLTQIARVLLDGNLITPLNNNRSIFTKDTSTNVNNCFYNSSKVTSITPVDITNRQTGLTNEQWSVASNFTGFDFDTVWNIVDNVPELRNNPLYDYDTSLFNCQISSVTRTNNTSFNVALSVVLATQYGVEIYKNDILIDTKTNSLTNIVTVDEVDDTFILKPFYYENSIKYYGIEVSYKHYANPNALATPISVAVTSSVSLTSPYPAPLVHGSILYNGFIYGVTRNIPFPITHGVLVKAPVHDLASYTTIAIRTVDLTDDQYVSYGYFSAQMEQVVECGGYLYFLFVCELPVSGNFICQYNPVINDYKTFRIDLAGLTEPIATDGTYLYVANYAEDRVYKIDPSQFINETLPKFNPTFQVTYISFYDASSQGGYILGSYPALLKGEIHSACTDAEYLYVSYTTDRNASSGYSNTYDVSVCEVHKIRKSDMTPAGFCKIPKSTDDMTQTSEWLFFGIELKANADPRAYGYGWAAYAVKKSDMTIRGIPKLHTSDNPPIVQSYASLIFGNYLIDMKTNSLTYIIDISDVENWSITENVGKRTVKSFTYTGVAIQGLIPNELVQQSDGTFYFFGFGNPSSLSEVILPDLNFFAEPTVSTLAPSISNSNVITLSGFILDSGGKDILERGFKWGTSPTELTNVITEVVNSGNSFSAQLPAINPGTYYFTAYAVNSEGTSTFEVKSFSFLKYYTRFKIVVGTTDYYTNNNFVYALK